MDLRLMHGCMALGLGLLLLCLPARAQDLTVALITQDGQSVVGPVLVRLRRSEAATFQDQSVKVGDTLAAGVEVLVPPRTEMEWLTANRTRLIAGPGTRLKLHSVRADGEVHSLIEGSLRVVVTRPLNFFNLGFSRFVALVRGTDFALRVWADGKAEAQLSEGRLQVDVPEAARVGERSTGDELARILALKAEPGRWLPFDIEPVLRQFDTPEAALGWAQQALVQARQGTDLDRLLAALNDLGQVQLAAAMPQDAVATFAEGEGLARTRGDLPWQARFANNRGAAHLAQQAWPEAQASLQQALALNEALYPAGGSLRLAGNANNLGLLAQQLGRLAEALAHHERADRVMATLGTAARPSAVAGMASNLARARLALLPAAPQCDRQTAEAVTLHAALLAVRQALQAALLRVPDEPAQRASRALLLNDLGVVAGRACEAAESERLHRQALALRDGDSGLAARAAARDSRLQIALALCRQRRYGACVAEAEMALAQARTLAPAGDDATVQTLRLLAQALASAGRTEESAQRAAEAQALQQRLRATVPEKR